MEEYDTLRIRLERKLGNTEEVSRLQQEKGFKSLNVKEDRQKKEELYDDFVDQYSNNDYEEPLEEISLVSKRTRRSILVILIIVAFGIGILSGVSLLNSNDTQVEDNTTTAESTSVTLTDSAFGTNATSQNNTDTQNNTTISKTTSSSSDSSSTTTKSSSSSTSKKSSSSSSSSSGSSSSGSSSSGSSSSGSSGSSSGSGSSSSGSNSGD
ncbi:MAG: hypothetical protein LUG89_01795 [Methanosphaera sp.]|nr:hypothetical protein [Methanosphaera sp.]